MVVFGQFVVGPPGAGKTTYCNGMRHMLEQLGRPRCVVNLDPANDRLPYECEIDIRDLINVEDVMDEFQLGPNGGLVYAMEYIEVNLDWLIERIRKEAAKVTGQRCAYVLFDCPGQVELYTHNEVMTKLTSRLVRELDFRLTAVHLVDSTLCIDAHRYLSAVLLSLSAMMQLELPHVNVLSKFDVLARQMNELDFRLDYYVGGFDLSQLLHTLQLNEHPLSQKFAKFNEMLIQLIDDFSLVRFEPLDIEEKVTVLRVLAQCDAANGHVFGEELAGEDEKGRPLRLYDVAMQDGREAIEDYIEKLEMKYLEEEPDLDDLALRKVTRSD